MCSLIDKVQNFCASDFFLIITNTMEIAGIRDSAGDGDRLCHQESTNGLKLLHNKVGWDLHYIRRQASSH